VQHLIGLNYVERMTEANLMPLHAENVQIAVQLNPLCENDASHCPKEPSFYVVAFVKFLVIGARVGPTLAGRFFPTL